MPRVPKWIPILLQSLVSIGLLGWIFWKPDFRQQIAEVLSTAHGGWLMAGFVLAGVGNLVGVWRWGIFLRVLDIRLRAWDVLRLSFVGLFFNNFMVGAIGGDAVKVVWLSAKGYHRTSALLSVLMDRMSGFPPLVVCSLLFMTLRLDWLMESPVVAGVIKFVFIYLLVIVLLLVLSFAVIWKGPPKFLPPWVPGRAWLMEFTDIYFRFVTAWRQSLAASFLSLIILITHFLTFYCSARAFDVRVPVLDFFAFMPAVDIIAALPVSLGGFGVREQLFARLLGDLAAVPVASAVSASLAGAFLSLVWGLFGLALLPSYRSVVEKQPKA